MTESAPSAANEPEPAQVPEPEVSPAPEAPATWASDGGGVEYVQEGDAGGWPPASGLVEDIDKSADA